MQEDTLPHLEEFERYTDGSMAALEQEQFTARLNSDKALQQEYDLFLSLQMGIKQYHQNRLKKELRETDASMPAWQPAQKKSPYQWLAAACATMLVAAGAWFWIKNGEQENQMAQYFIDDPGLPVLMSDDADMLRAETMNLYRTGNYEEALNKLREIPSDKLGKDTLHFYQGLFLLKLNQPDSALVYLEPVSLSQSAFAERAEYYTALANWEQNEVAVAKKQFEEMASNPQHTFYDIAKEILTSELFK